MRITIVHRYFWPDNAPYAQMLFKIAGALTSAQHDVSVLTSHPSHDRGKKNIAASRENINGIKIRRLPLLPEFGRKTIFRALNTLFFSIEVFLLLLVRKTDVVMIATTPPVVMAFIVNLASRIRQFEYVYHCQDIHPEAMALIKAIDSNGFLYRILKRIDAYNLKKARAVVVLSNDMKNTLSKRDVGNKNIQVINNFIFDSGTKGDIVPELDDRYFNILFAGNLGKFQGLYDVINAARLLEDNKKIRFIFLGDGVEKSCLEKRSSDLLDNTVYFIEPVSVSNALEYMELSDMGLITVAPGIIDVAYPSKTMMYLSAGLPFVAIVEKYSELSRIVESEKLGYSAEPGVPEMLKDMISNAYLNRTHWRKDKERIKQVAQSLFSEKAILNKWVKLFDGIVQ